MEKSTIEKLISTAKEKHGTIRPICNRPSFNYGIRVINGKPALWYERKIPEGWTSSIAFIDEAISC